MQRKNSRSVFLKNNCLVWKHVFSHVFPDACLGFRFGILPPAGQRSQKKTRSLDSVLESCLRRVRDLKKNTSREKNTHI